MRLFALATLTALVAQTPGAPAPRYERTIAVASPGPQRLAIDASLVAGAAPFTVVRRGAAVQRLVAEGGLSDLRLFAQDGREVPYLLVYPPVHESEWLRAPVQPIAPRDTAKDKTSGFEADLGSAKEVDAIDLRSLRGPFMKRFSLAASADREHWTEVISDGTLFDLPDRQLRETQAVFAPGLFRYLRLTWDDAHSARMPLVPDVFVRRAAAAGAAPPPLVVPLRFERRPSEPGRSRYHLTLPASRLPLVALRLEAGGTYLFRSVTVTEPRLTAWQATPAAIGSGLLARDHASGTALRVPINQPTQAELDLVVDDGDNPPLDLRGIAGEFAELPWIYVEAPGPLVARYGDPNLPPPRYDLEAARQSLRIDTLPEARWASPPVEPAAAPRSRIDAARFTGGPIDVSAFRFAREIAAGSSELVALPLDAAVLAHSAGPAREFADVRIVEGTDRQVPRLVERRPEPLVVPLRAEPATSVAAELQPRAGQHRSVYHVTLPYADLPEARLVIETTAPMFERPIEIGYERPADRAHRDPWFHRIASATWSRTEDTSGILTLPLNAPVAEAAQLTLVIDEGDNSALPIANVQLLLPSYRLRFVRPTTPARLVYGNPAADQPRYDLALLAPTVLSAPVVDVTMTAEGETKTGRAVATRLVSPAMFWAILGLAVIALVGVLVGLLRRT